MPKRKNTMHSLKKALKEAETPTRPESMSDFQTPVEKSYSVDQAIDKYFVQYERESIPTSEIYESVKVDGLLAFLLEQVDAADPPEDDELDLGGDTDEGGLDLGGGDLDLDTPTDEAPDDDVEEPPEAVVSTPKINLQDFARSLARLVNNVHSLMDLNTLVLNRAEKYIQSNYDENTARELLGILDTTYDLRPTTEAEQLETANKYPTPHTAVTGPVGG